MRTNVTLHSSLPDMILISDDEAANNVMEVREIRREHDFILIKLLDTDKQEICYLAYRMDYDHEAEEGNAIYNAHGHHVKAKFYEDLSNYDNIFVRMGLLTKEQADQIKAEMWAKRDQERIKHQYAEYLRLKEQFEPKKAETPTQYIKPRKVYRGLRGSKLNFYGAPNERV